MILESQNHCKTVFGGGPELLLMYIYIEHTYIFIYT